MKNDIVNSGDEFELLIKVAQLYYEQQLNQAEIGKQLKTSRSTVSRLLQRARDEGIVQISIRYPWDRHIQLEEQIRQLFHLHTVRVLRSMNRSPEDVRDGMGVLAAEYLDSVLRDDMILGVSYGRSILSTVRQLRPSRKLRLTVVQIIGALGSGNPLIEGPDLAREIANAYGAQYRYLHAPLIVEDRRTRDLLIQEPNIQETLEIGRKASVVLMGIGSLTASTSGLIWTGYLTERDQTWLRNIGAVGHMCAQFFDDHGKELDIELNKRTIGIGLQTLHHVNDVITIAGSREKAHAILGALRGGYLNTLITDDQAAQEVVALEQRARAEGH